MLDTVRLRDLQFVDLYVGSGYADAKGMPGAHAPRAPLAPVYGDEIAQVREQCASLHSSHGEPEFALLHDDVLYRVTAMLDLRAEAVYFIRRMAASIRRFDALGLPPDLYGFLMRASTRGLIVITGETTVGKTSTAASLLAARLAAHGGFALAIEDPPETQLDGLHGEGRCIQVPATRRNGHYGEQLRSAMRTGVSTLLIGEIRDRATAVEAIKHSTNGLTVITTAHAKDPSDAIGRILSYAGTEDIANPQDILASGLACIVHQRMERAGASVRLLFRTLTASGSDESAVRTLIRDGRLDQLAQIVDSQARRQLWQP
jgi:twitching motility protein PilT